MSFRYELPIGFLIYSFLKSTRLNFDFVLFWQIDGGSSKRVLQAPHTAAPPAKRQRPSSPVANSKAVVSAKQTAAPSVKKQPALSKGQVSQEKNKIVKKSKPAESSTKKASLKPEKKKVPEKKATVKKTVKKPIVTKASSSKKVLSKKATSKKTVLKKK